MRRPLPADAKAVRRNTGAMCNRYETPTAHEVQRYWNVHGHKPPSPWPHEVFPRAPGAFIRRNPETAGYERELVLGQWGLIPWFAKEPKLKFPTNNARSEELEDKASYKEPWKRGQRCIIPAATFDEPNWESGKNVWWRFKRADGDPWGLAGLWNTWTDNATGEAHESYTMLTINADDHPLMRRMHKPNPKAPADKPDKRSVIPLDPADFDQWLEGTPVQARKLLKLAPVKVFEAGPVGTS
jgi:putative SOS response-associated peptidase YedK